MRVFVTGGTGFLGGYVIRTLMERGHQVIALVRDAEAASGLAERGVRLTQGDITDASSLEPGMDGADALVHMAAWYKVGVYAPDRMWEVNVAGTRNVLEAMRQHGLTKGVYTSSLAVFSDTHGKVHDETYRHEGPHLSVYDRTKWIAHYDVAEPMMESGLPLVIVQPGVLYGPGDTSQSGQLLRDWLDGRLPYLPRGLNVCWTHVEDAALGHVLALERGRPGQSYIIAGPCHAYEDAFALAARITGKSAPPLRIPAWAMKAMSLLSAAIEALGIRLPERFRAESLRVSAGATYLGSNAKARRELGYEPRGLEEGLRQTLPALLEEAGQPS